MALMDHLPKVTQRIRPNLTKGIDDLTLDSAHSLRVYRRQMLAREAKRDPLAELIRAFERSANTMSQLHNHRRD